jgi:hypothetical protein
LFMTDWYIDQMKTKRMSLILANFFYAWWVRGDKLDYVVNIPKQIADGIMILMIFIKNPKSTVQMQNGQTIHFYPTIRLEFQWTRTRSLKNKVVGSQYFDSIVPLLTLI